MALKDLVSGRGPVESLAPDAERAVPKGVSAHEVATFFEEARRSVRLNAGKRLALTVLSEDRPGLVADIADRVSALALNIEGASQTRIGPFAALSLVVSSETLQSAPHLAASVGAVGPLERPASVFAVALDPGAPTVPTADFTTWVLKMTVRERPGVLNRVAKPIAAVNGVLVRLVSSVSDSVAETSQRCTIEVCFAVPPDTDVQDVHCKISEAVCEPGEAIDPPEVARTPATVDRVINPIPMDLDRAEVALIVGDARPGLVESVTAAFAEMHVSILGSTMAILEGRTVAIFAIDVANVSPTQLSEALEEPRRKYRLQVEWMKPPVGELRTLDGDPYYFDMVVPEEPGQLARAARVFSNHGCNIEGLYARVVGAHRPPACTVGMVVRIPAGHVDAVRSEMDQVARAAGWYEHQLVTYDAQQGPPRPSVY